MVDHRTILISGLTLTILILCQLPSYQTEKVQKSSAKVSAVPSRRIVPLSSSDILAAQLLKEPFPQFDATKLKRTVRKLDNDESGDSLDAVNPDEYQGVVGRPGIDFPVLSTIPVTKFSCRQYKSPGYYADLDTNCQVFHICDGGRKISFLCPNGTIFRQSHLICDWWFRVDCSNSVNLYEESAEQLAIDQQAYKSKSKTQENVNQKENNFQENYKITPTSNSFQQAQEVPQDTYTSKAKASGNQPLQQNTFTYQANQNQKPFAGNNQKQYPEVVTPSPSAFYAPQNRFQANPYNSDSRSSVNENLSGNSINSRQQNVQNNVASQSKNYNPSNSKIYSGGNSLDSESQVLAESVNYGASKQNRYNPDNYYSIDGTQKQYTPYQQSSVYTQNKYQPSAINQQINHNSQSNLNQKAVYSQPSTIQPPNNYSPSSTAQQSSTFAQSSTIQPNNINLQPSTIQQTSNYAQSTTVEQPRNYPQTNNFQQKTNYPQSTTLQQNTNYPQTTNQQNTNYPQTTNQQNTNYPQTTNQQNTNYPQTTVQQNTNYPQSTTLQQNTNYPQTTVQQNTNYPQSTTIQQNTNYPQSTTGQQGGSYSQPSTVQQTTFYQQNSPQSTTYQPETTYQQGTSADLLRSQNISSYYPSSYSTLNYPSTNYVSYTTPSYQETSTPVYSTIRESTPAYSTYTTLKDSYPSTFSYNPSTVYSTFSSSPTTSPELLSTLNFNRASQEKSNLVPESINNVADENSSRDAVNLLDSISIYYDQINNKESVRLPISNQDTKNKISVSDIFLNQESHVPLSPASFDLSNALPSVLTDSTKEGYTYLFSNGSRDDSLNKENDQTIQEFPRNENDLATQQNQGIFQSSYSTVSTTTTTQSPKVTESQKDLELRHSSDLRELAQVFSRALSAYLEDPENFRRILSEVRPTEPNIKSTTANPHQNEVLEFSEDIKFSPPRNPSSTPTAYTTVRDAFRASSIANQVNNLVTDNSYFPAPKNLYGGFQNNTFSYPSSPNIVEGTTQTYFSVSPLVDVTREPKVYRYNSPTTPIPVTTYTYDERNSNAIGAQDVNNLVPRRNQYEDETYDKNNVFSSDKYDYSFGANAKKTTQQYTDTDDLESLVPYDSQSIVSRDNLLRFQDAQQKYYSTFKYGPVENFSKPPETYQSPTVFQSTPSVTPTYFYNERVSSQSIPSSTYSSVNFVPTESTPFLQSSSPFVQNQFVPQTINNSSMYQEAKELFGNLNETSANILMHMMHEAESNSTLRRLVLLLVNDKTGKKTPEESRNKLLEALLQMPQRVPSYPPNSISRTPHTKVARRVKVVKGRMLPNNERSSTKYNRDVKAEEAKPANNPQSESLLPEKLSSESDTRAVELLKSLYVLAAKWG